MDHYENEVWAKDDTASHPMFKAMKDELNRVRKLGFEGSRIRMKCVNSVPISHFLFELDLLIHEMIGEKVSGQF